MNPVKLAIIGVGHLGRIHARLAKSLEGAEIVGIVDPVAAARSAVAEELGAEAFADFRQLPPIDAAIVATPTDKHHQVARELLARGVHVLVEKPLAATLDEADELVAAAEQSGAILQVGHVERFNPALVRVRPQIEDPKYIDAVRTSGYPFRSTDIGVVHDLMIHDLDVALSLAGSPVVEVQALGLSVLGKHEDAANARVTFENGCVANFTASRVSYRSERSMQVWSPRGFTAIDFGMRNTTTLRPHEQLLAREFDLDALTGEEKNHLKSHLFDELFTRQTVEGAEGNALAEEQRDFIECIRTAGEPQVTGAQGRDALALAEQIVERIDAHAWDGYPGGRTGAHAMPQTPILRGVHWDLAADPPATRREAG